MIGILSLCYMTLAAMVVGIVGLSPDLLAGIGGVALAVVFGYAVGRAEAPARREFRSSYRRLTWL